MEVAHVQVLCEMIESQRAEVNLHSEMEKATQRTERVAKHNAQEESH